MSGAALGRPGGTGRHVAYVLRSNPVTALAAAGAALLVLVGLLAPLLSPYDPVVSNVPHALEPPSALHWAGTDQLGRDILSRIITATRLDTCSSRRRPSASPLRSARWSAGSAATAGDGWTAGSGASWTC